MQKCSCLWLLDFLCIDEFDIYRLLDVAQEATPLQEAFLLADDVLRQVQRT